MRYHTSQEDPAESPREARGHAERTVQVIAASYERAPPMRAGVTTSVEAGWRSTRAGRGGRRTPAGARHPRGVRPADRRGPALRRRTQPLGHQEERKRDAVPRPPAPVAPPHARALARPLREPRLAAGAPRRAGPRGPRVSPTATASSCSGRTGSSTTAGSSAGTRRWATSPSASTGSASRCSVSFPSRAAPAAGSCSSRGSPSPRRAPATHRPSSAITSGSSTASGSTGSG